MTSPSAVAGAVFGNIGYVALALGAAGWYLGGSFWAGAGVAVVGTIVTFGLLIAFGRETRVVFHSGPRDCLACGTSVRVLPGDPVAGRTEPPPTEGTPTPTAAPPQPSGNNWFWVWAIVIGLGVWLLFLRPNLQRESIEQALKAEKALATRISAEANSADVAWDQSGITGRYVSGLRAIDVAGCPEDFRAAFARYIDAWSGYEKFARKYGGFRGFLRGLFSGVTVVFAAASDFADAEAEIVRARDEVQRVAVKYGARMP